MFKGQSCQTEKFILNESFAEAGTYYSLEELFLIFGILLLQERR